MKYYIKIWSILSVCIILLCGLMGCSVVSQKNKGKIYLYGETHASVEMIEKELSLWDEYYQQGMRDLFIEYPYYTAEFLNMWMKSENDTILETLYEDWNGGFGHSEVVKAFFKRIKANYPETVFHGTDVGHSYDTTGKRYLEYLQSIDKQDSEEYDLTMEIIKQGKVYYQVGNDSFRENKMTENFMREYEKLDGVSIMGIYGAGHIRSGLSNFTNMASRLSKEYGEKIVVTEDLSDLVESIKSEKVSISGKQYIADYYGKVDISSFSTEYKFVEFWRIEDAYEDFSENELGEDFLAYRNYPMNVEEKQVFAIDYIKEDGTKERKYHRSDGNLFQGELITEEFYVR